MCLIWNSVSPPHCTCGLAVDAEKAGLHDGSLLPLTIITYLGVNNPVCFRTSEIDFCIFCMSAEVVMVK